MLKKIYAWLYKKTARQGEAGEYSGGFVQGVIRQRVLELCRGCAGKVLEIGVGSGLFIMKLAAENPGVEISGVDLDESLLDSTWAKIDLKGLGNVKLFRQDATKLAFAEDHFDTVICINFFLDVNLDNVKRILGQMRRVVKRPGRVIFEFRNSRNLLFRLKYMLAKYYDPTCPYPLYTYSPEKIELVMREAGLEVVRRTYVGFPVSYVAPIIIIEARKV